MCQAKKETEDSVQCIQDITNADLKAIRREYLFECPKWMLSYVHIADVRDIPLVHCVFNLTILLTLSASIVLLAFVQEWSYRNWIGLAHVLFIMLCLLERWVLCLHFISHRPVFGSWLDGIPGYYCSMFFGMCPGFYHIHHVMMHHKQNNVEGGWAHNDLSSTEMYQRDSVFAFMKYLARFHAIWFELVEYVILGLTRTKPIFSRALVTRLVVLLCGFIAYSVALYSISPMCMIWMLAIPYCICWTALAFGNFSQHIFLDPRSPHLNYSLTYNCMNVSGNQTTFNDGYHVLHHLNANRHWADLPAYFMEPSTLKKHSDHGALTFTNIHFVDVGILVFTGQLNKLVRNHYVHLGYGPVPSVEEVVEELKYRLISVNSQSEIKKKPRFQGTMSQRTEWTDAYNSRVDEAE